MNDVRAQRFAIGLDNVSEKRDSAVNYNRRCESVFIVLLVDSQAPVSEQALQYEGGSPHRFLSRVTVKV